MQTDNRQKTRVGTKSRSGRCYKLLGAVAVSSAMSVGHAHGTAHQSKCPEHVTPVAGAPSLAGKAEPATKNTRSRVIRVLAEQLAISAKEIKPTSRIVEDLCADSLDAVEIVMALEEEFNIEVPDADVPKIHDVNDVVRYIRRHHANHLT